ncbi:pyruvate, phosphate dikinase [Candidatus Saccharibacteria bacterium]|nr:pyruvate, phosphate dikinase [Calditrichia bacterium]NIV98847.1 pyruvate, phosphate dikinase [Candidatus Saccharibacteria bacterium]
MTNYLGWSGIAEAKALLGHFAPFSYLEEIEPVDEANRPQKKKQLQNFIAISEEIFKIANQHLNEQDILALVQKWIKEDKSGFLVNILENPGTSLEEIFEAIERYHHLLPQGMELTEPREKGFRVALIRRLLTDQPHFINIAKNFINVNEFNTLLHRIVFPPQSHGKLGGKTSGLFLANQILKKTAHDHELLKNVKIPKTWYLTSDCILHFLHHNNLEEVIEQKYKEIWQVRQEYPYIVQVFKNSSMPPEIIKGLSLALDDFAETPLIVRSSSLLEDRMGTAFAGKYRSLFIANQGSKEERLSALIDAIAEVYASTFGPDPIEYRVERGLVDYHEEMGIMIQEVVGNEIGDYFIPAFAGVAFSKNEFRWSSRIKQSDGLVRMVAGLGTRAVDRLSDDYPTLIAPGQPGLRVNVQLDEILRYSQRKIDVINLKQNTFETINLHQLFREVGSEYPAVEKIISVLDHDHVHQPSLFNIDFENDRFVVNFEGLLNDTPFVNYIHTILRTLEEKLDTPVDIEFAHDGRDFYLLQCRPQSYHESSIPATIPSDLGRDKVIFSANRFISNGTVSDITHIVYVDPQKYSELSTKEDLMAVGRAVGKLNQLLPKRQFILMGPGRWGSRGDIKLGVNVTYSDINNAAVLSEIARKKGNYLPDLSFGTHFFQDLVESHIRYLPLYPDEETNIFNEEFFQEAPNILPELLPDFAYLSDTIKVIDVPKAAGDKALRILMNADVERAVAILTESRLSFKMPTSAKPKLMVPHRRHEEDHWRWRLRIAEKIASELDIKRFGVKGCYVFGSAKNATAGPASDIDLLIHFQGNEQQQKDLTLWLEGWSLCVGEINFMHTGHKSDGLLDVHIITDEDIKKGNSYALKINAVTDAARPLPIKK